MACSHREQFSKLHLRFVPLHDELSYYLQCQYPNILSFLCHACLTCFLSKPFYSFFLLDYKLQVLDQYAYQLFLRRKKERTSLYCHSMSKFPCFDPTLFRNRRNGILFHVFRSRFNFPKTVRMLQKMCLSNLQ